MDRRYVFIRDLSTHMLTWTIKVQVTRVSGPHLSNDEKTRYKRLTLVDEKGTVVSASIFGEDIELFEDTLQQGKWYFVTRGKLTETRPEFRSGSSSEIGFQLTIKKYTKVEVSDYGEDNNINIPAKEFDFLPLKDLATLSHERQRIDIVAVVLGVSPEEKRKRKHDHMDVSLREITLTDSSLCPVVLSTWGRFIPNECESLSEMITSMPIIIATNLRAKDINGKKLLSTSANTDILINPDTPEAQELKTWKLNFKDELECLSKGSSHVSIMEQPITIDCLRNSTNLNATYCIKAAIVNILPQERSWYMVCNSCRRKTSAPHKTMFACQGCHKENVSAEPCFCLRVEIGDSTGSIEAVIFGNQAEKIVSCKAETIMNLGFEEHFDFLEKLMGECTGIEHVFLAKLVKARADHHLRITAIRDEGVADHH